MELASGTLLERGKYRIISTLGQGGFGITYLAEQVMAERKVCIKEFFPKDYYNRDENACSISLVSKGGADIMNAYKAKFIKEAKTIANLDHPNIIHIIDVFEENNTAYYVMEYVNGGSLRDIVKQQGALPEALAVRYIRAIADALSYIHEQRINHLDVKPGNIVVHPRSDHAVLIDFGLSKHYKSGGDQTSSTPVGISHGYAPIEQYKAGGVSTFSPATDIYSLGATLYYLVTGMVPPSATDIGRDGIDVPNANISPSVRRTIKHSTSYWREDRPQCIEEFLMLLDNDEVAAPVVASTSASAEVTVLSVESATTSEPTKASVSTAPVTKRGYKALTLLMMVLIGIIAGVATFFLLGGFSKSWAPKKAAETVVVEQTEMAETAVGLVEDECINWSEAQTEGCVIDEREVNARRPEVIKLEREVNAKRPEAMKSEVKVVKQSQLFTPGHVEEEHGRLEGINPEAMFPPIHVEKEQGNMTTNILQTGSRGNNIQGMGSGECESNY